MADRIRISIKSNRAHHFCTEEDVKTCPSCGRFYKYRKVCLNCGSDTILTTKIHKGHVDLDLKCHGCDCIFLSFYGQSKHWQKKHPGSRCKHVKLAITEILRLADVSDKTDNIMVPQLFVADKVYELEELEEYYEDPI